MFPLCNFKDSFTNVGVLGTHWGCPMLSEGNGSSSTEQDENVMSFCRMVGSLAKEE